MLDTSPTPLKYQESIAEHLQKSFSVLTVMGLGTDLAGAGMPMGIWGVVAIFVL